MSEVQKIFQKVWMKKWKMLLWKSWSNIMGVSRSIGSFIVILWIYTQSLCLCLAIS